MEYEWEELLEIVGELTEKYTSKESTSVTYETAQQLMGAVLFCIRENGMDGSPAEPGTSLYTERLIPAREAYRQGYEKVMQKVLCAKTLYERLLPDFKDYGNRCLHDTFFQGIGAFFQNYDIKFNPQDKLLTLDYPVLMPLGGYEGIDAVYRYLQCLQLEQLFLDKFLQSLVTDCLADFHPDYRELFNNLASILLGTLFACMITGRKLQKSTFTEEDYRMLSEYILECPGEELAVRLKGMLRILIRTEYEDNLQLFEYLSLGTGDISCRLRQFAAVDR